jgi:hypothetical protein
MRVSYTWDGRAGSLLLPVAVVIGKDYLADGVYSEFLAIAQYDLARAIADYVQGEHLVTLGDEQGARKAYMAALNHLGSWDNQASFRAGRHPLLADAVSHSIIANSGNGEVTAEALRRAWSEFAPTVFALKWHEGAAIVSMCESFASQPGGPSSPPEEAVQFLLHGVSPGLADQ